MGDVKAATGAAGAAAEHVARQSYGKLVAYLCKHTRDVAAAQDALSAAFEAALAQWPATGMPATPEAWLMTVARRQVIDAHRRHQTREDAVADLLLLTPQTTADVADVAHDLPDERLALLFVCAHPAIDAALRAPLMLQTVLGLNAADIASAFLVPPATMGQRLSRAKDKIKQAGIAFRVPERQELPERLDAVLQAIYAAYTQGWSDPGGLDARSHALTDEGIWLGQLIVALLPQEPEALGMLALMLYTHARRHARRDGAGRYVPLAVQNTAHWDGSMLDTAERLLLRAAGLRKLGRFQLEAAVQSAHTVRRRVNVRAAATTAGASTHMSTPTPAATATDLHSGDGAACCEAGPGRPRGQSDWAAIEQLYAALETMTGSPVVSINRAVAVAELQDAQAGLALLDALAADPRMRDYQPYWAARAQLLVRARQHATTHIANNAANTALDSTIDSDIDTAFTRAIGLEYDPAVRDYLQQQRISATNK